jgi:hypothetical protein
MPVTFSCPSCKNLWRTIIPVIAIVLFLSACSPGSPEQLPTPTLPASATPSPTATPAPTATLTPTATPIIEPVLPALSAAAELPVQPPDFNLPSSVSEVGLTFDFVDAHAVYALFREQEGPGMWAHDADFTSAMQSYLESLSIQGINLQQVTVEGLTFSLLTKGNQILLNFENGVLKDVDPGRWSKDSTPEWIDVGGPVELFIGDDGHAYIAKVDADGNVIAFLNPIGATIDNLDQQWVGVEDGLPTQVWNPESGQYENVYYRWDNPELLSRITTEFEQQYGLPWDQFFIKMVEQKYTSTGASYHPLIEIWGFYGGTFNGIMIGQETVTNPADHSQALVVYIATQGVDRQPKLLPYTIAVNNASGFGYTTINTFTEGADYTQNKNPLLPTSLSQLKSEISQYLGHKMHMSVIIRFGSPDQCNQSESPVYLNTTTPTFWQYINRICKQPGSYLNSLSLEPTALDPNGHPKPKLLPSMESMLTEKGDVEGGLLVNKVGFHTIAPPQQ